MKLGTERRARVLDIVAKVDSLVYERAQLAVDYTVSNGRGADLPLAD